MLPRSYRSSDTHASGIPIDGSLTLAPMRERERSPFGDRLFQARKHAKLTQPQLASAVGMAQGTLAEAERSGLGSSFTAQIARVCGVRAEWLATGLGEMLEAGYWPFSEELKAAVADLDEASLATLENVMRSFVGLPSQVASSATRQTVTIESTQQQTPAPSSSTVDAPVKKYRRPSEGLFDVQTGSQDAVGEPGRVPKQRRRKDV